MDTDVRIREGHRKHAVISAQVMSAIITINFILKKIYLKEGIAFALTESKTEVQRGGVA